MWKCWEHMFNPTLLLYPSGPSVKWRQLWDLFQAPETWEMRLQTLVSGEIVGWKDTGISSRVRCHHDVERSKPSENLAPFLSSPDFVGPARRTRACGHCPWFCDWELHISINPNKEDWQDYKVLFINVHKLFVLDRNWDAFFLECSGTPDSKRLSP